MHKTYTYCCSFVSASHLFVGVLYCLIGWGFGFPKRAVFSPPPRPFSLFSDKITTSLTPLFRNFNEIYDHGVHVNETAFFVKKTVNFGS